MFKLSVVIAAALFACAAHAQKTPLVLAFEKTVGGQAVDTRICGYLGEMAVDYATLRNSRVSYARVYHGTIDDKGSKVLREAMVLSLRYAYDNPNLAPGKVGIDVASACAHAAPY